MIKILILDDNPAKINALKIILTTNLNIPLEAIEIKNDLHTGKKELLKTQYDLLILDLVLPERFGDFPEVDAGFHFLKELNFDDQYFLPNYILGFTAYSDLTAAFDKDFHMYLSLIITYTPEYLNWQEEIVFQIKNIIRKKGQQNEIHFAYDYDLAIVTALIKPELESILTLMENCHEKKIVNDSTSYYEGFFRNKDRKIRVVAAAAEQMGLTAAATLSNKIISHFRPKYLAICGIAAGVKGKTSFGDIIIADIVWDYGTGKITTLADGSAGFKQEPRQIPLDPTLKALFQKEDLRNEVIPKIKSDWDKLGRRKKSKRLTSFIAPIASGAAVVENIKIMKDVEGRQRKLLAIDMEAYAIFYAALYSTDPKPKAIAIKSVCDFGDSKKNDRMQYYAAFTSARYLYYFSLSYL